MTKAANWRDVKAKARAIDPTWDDPERVARREQIGRRLLASLDSARSAPADPKTT